MAYEKDKDYSALIADAVASGDYKSAAQYEQQRNEKISGEGITDYAQTNKYAGWLDDTDYSSILTDQMESGASADDVYDTLDKRIRKASGTEGLSQYAQDDVYSAAMDYILNHNKASQEFSYEEAPAWSSKYSAQIDELAQSLLGREGFSYDKETDPLYAQYKDTYTREGNRAMQDTIGQVSARTGGLASSYAATAGTQANDYYMSQLADKVPELQQLAYSMYQDEGDRQMQNLQLLMALEEGDYAKYADLLSQYNADRSFDYGVYADEKASDYKEGRDAVDDSRYDTEWQHKTEQDAVAGERYDTEWQYQTEQDAKNEAQNRIADYLAAGGKVAGLDQALVATSGYTQAELAALESYYAGNVGSGGGRSGGSGGGRSGGGKSGGSGGSGGAGGDDDYEISNQHGDSWIYIPGHGRFSYQEVYNYVESGKVTETVDHSTGKVSYKWYSNKKQ